MKIIYRRRRESFETFIMLLYLWEVMKDHPHRSAMLSGNLEKLNEWMNEVLFLFSTITIINEKNILFND